MGFHVCEFCHTDGKENRFSHLSSGDVNLTFANGHRWVMPDMILHYIADHRWQPPQEFINDVMTQPLSQHGRLQTRGISINEIFNGTRIGYLSGELTTGPVPADFIEKLEELMKLAAQSGNRAQTKGI
ncbi:MAG: hypothetical protein WCT16_01360 [Candidatus Buchananbacteria bacterium]